MKTPKCHLLLAIALLCCLNSSGQLSPDSIAFIKIEVPVYQEDPFTQQVILPASYASAILNKTENWLEVAPGNQVYEIDLVFTLYPQDISRWRTDYNQLLQDRIQALLEVDSAFSDPEIKWNMILQTACKTESEAIRYFHGFVVKYRPLDYERIEEVKSPEDLQALLSGIAVPQDSTVIKIVNRHPEWQDMLVVMDWTGSMYRYGAQLVLWHKENLRVNQNRTKHLVFFNDGNAKRGSQKVIGRTGGVYLTMAENIEKVVMTMEKVMLKGAGGDPEENDLEALLKSTRNLEGFQDVILIADNKSDVRDLRLLDKLDRPVHIILCGIEEDNYINTDYVKIAYYSGGSLHTLEQDLEDLQQLQPGERIAIGNMRYEIRNGSISQMAKSND
jgi:hypothetical protein